MQGIHSQCRRRSVLLLCQWWAFLKFLNHQVPQTSILFNLFNFAFSAQWLRGSTQSLPWSCALPFLHPSPFASSLHSTQGMEVYCKSSSQDYVMAWSFFIVIFFPGLLRWKVPPLQTTAWSSAQTAWLRSLSLPSSATTSTPSGSSLPSSQASSAAALAAFCPASSSSLSLAALSSQWVFLSG